VVSYLYTNLNVISNFYLFVGIFAYLNYLTPRTRLYILENLIKGLKRLEYRGYDSAGVAFDVDNNGACEIRLFLIKAIDV